MECKLDKGKRYCKVSGKWIEMKEDKYSAYVSSSQPIKIQKNVKVRSGVC